jgi:phosphopentomutase
MGALGLCHAAVLASGVIPDGMTLPDTPQGAYGAACEISRGKDTPSGHWEMAGTPVLFDWGYFPKGEKAFPDALVEAICREGGVSGILGNCHASGTQVIAEWGAEHMRSGKPICYTSVDSVLQIAAHETTFGLDRLLALCKVVRRLVDPLNIGRVIARPFTGDCPDNFERTGNRRDFSVLPPEPTVLDRLVAAGHQVHAIGKIGDIFAHQGISTLTKAHGNMALFDATLAAFETAQDGDLVFTNFVDFDMLYGHRRDVAGYADALEAFDRRLPELFARLRQGDLVILTADHGCDPTWPGTDHTRERVPVLAFGPGIKPGSIGILETFADIGESIAAHLGIAPGAHGRSFI